MDKNCDFVHLNLIFDESLLILPTVTYSRTNKYQFSLKICKKNPLKVKVCINNV